MAEEEKTPSNPFEKKPGERRLVVIDGNHLIHRAFHAIQAPLRTSAGEPTNAIFGFASVMLNILEREKPDAFAVAFDEKAPTFRHEAHAGYKATRVKAPDELYAQIPRIQEMIAQFHVSVYSKEGFEADDLMGTLAKKAEAEGVYVHLVTGDRDLFQLVDSHVKVVFPHKAYREPLVFDAQKVYEMFGVRPDQIVDYKALAGDTSDNLQGVPGIGPKGAADLLARYDTLDGIYAHLEALPLKTRQKLEAGRESARLTQAMAQIVTTVPCVFSMEEASVRHLDFVGLQRFFERMEMKSLQTRLKKALPAEVLNPKEQMSLF